MSTRAFVATLRREVARVDPRGRGELPPVPDTFVGFCDATCLSPPLSPGQRVFTLVAYDGVDPCDLEGEERELARKIFGDVDRFSAEQRATVVAVVGARGGKTSRLIALRLVWGALVRDLSSLAPGQVALALVVAPNDELRQEFINYALGALLASPWASMVRLPKGAKPGDAVSEFKVVRPDGHVVRFAGGVATRGGYGGRGKSLTDFAMDESAFFRDASFAVNDTEIFRAASARVLPGGQSIVASTPWGRSGLLYEMHDRNWGHPVDAVSAHAPTTVLNPSPWVASIVAREQARDPENAEREFGAGFMTSGTTVFLDPSLIAAAKALPVDIVRPGDMVFAGADLGFRSDSASLVIVARRGDAYFVALVLELRPEPGKPLEPGVVCKAFAEEIRAHGGSYCMADGHYAETLREHLTAAGLVYAPAPSDTAEPFVRTRMLLRGGQVAMAPHERLEKQLKEIVARPTSGGGLSITMPRWRTGGHGDIASALVLALYQAQGVAVPAPPPKDGSPEWEAAEREKRRKRIADEQQGLKRRHA